MDVTNTVGGGRDQSAVIGHAPEDAHWVPGSEAHPPLIDETARVEALVTIDAGTREATRIGRGSWLLKHSHIGHDAQIGEDVVIACHAIIGGHVTIGDGAFVGLGAIVAPFRAIGAGAQVEAGAVVIHDVPANTRVAGNPARVLPPRRTDKFTDRPASEREAHRGARFEGEELRWVPASRDAVSTREKLAKFINQQHAA